MKLSVAAAALSSTLLLLPNNYYSSVVVAQNDDNFCCFVDNEYQYEQDGNNCDLCDPSCTAGIYCYNKVRLCGSRFSAEAPVVCDSTGNADPNGEYCCDGAIDPMLFIGNLRNFCMDGDVYNFGSKVCPAPTHSGGGGNDPHFKTWAGQFFDYHGECDLVLLADPQFYNGLGLIIHIRTKARYDYSFIESAAIQIGDDVLEVSGFGQHMINGIAQALDNNDGAFQIADKFPLTYHQKNAKEHTFTIGISGEERIVVSTFKDWVSVKVLKGTEANFGNSMGLMGRFEDGATVDRNGTVAKDVLDVDGSRNAFGQEWQVMDTEPQLFQAVRAPQYPQKCILPDKKVTTGRRRLGASTISESAAKNACAHWKNEKQQEMCINDVIASGDLEVANVNPF